MIMKILARPGSNKPMNRFGVPAIFAVTVILIAGCASIPAPTEQLAVSRAEVTSATRDGGNEFAPLELRSAVDKMERAERAMAAEDYVLARRLAEQAQLDARLAATRTGVAKAEKSVEDSQESNRILQEEIRRTTR